MEDLTMTMFLEHDDEKIRLFWIGLVINQKVIVLILL